MKTALLITGILFSIVSTVLDENREFKWRRFLRDVFLVAGILIIRDSFFIIEEESSELVISKPITITLTATEPEIMIREIQEEYDIQELDTINDITFLITLCRQQKNEK